MFIEFKAPGQIPSPAQERTMESLVRYRCEVAVVDNVEKGKRLVDLISDAENYRAFVYGPDRIGLTPVSDTGH